MMKYVSAGASFFFAVILAVMTSMLGACTKSEQPTDNKAQPASSKTSDKTKRGIGVYTPGEGKFFLHNSATSGEADLAFTFGPSGNAGWLPVAGDWDGDGITTPGLYDPSRGIWYLRSSNPPGEENAVSFNFGPGGNAGWLPIAGDWDGDGKDTVGLYDPSRGLWFLRNSNAANDDKSATFPFGPGSNTGWLPVAGDWDGDGKDSPGLYDPSKGLWFLRKNNAPEEEKEPPFIFGPGGNAGLLPVVGDWDGNGSDSVGLYSPADSGWFLKNSNSAGSADVKFSFGFKNSKPVAGRWK